MIGEDAEAGNRTVDPCEGNEGCHCEERSDTAISIKQCAHRVTKNASSLRLFAMTV